MYPGGELVGHVNRVKFSSWVFLPFHILKITHFDVRCPQMPTLPQKSTEMLEYLYMPVYVLFAIFLLPIVSAKINEVIDILKYLPPKFIMKTIGIYY